MKKLSTPPVFFPVSYTTLLYVARTERRLARQ